MEFINKGIETIKRAVEADEAGEKAEAFRFYRTGIDYLVTACKYEKTTKRREILRARVVDYIIRAEEIKAELQPQPSPSSSSSSLVKPIPRSGKSTTHHNGSSEAATEDKERRALLEASTLSLGDGVAPVHWNDIAGLETAKQMLREAVVLPMRLPHLFGTDKGQRKPWSAILLYGPPGTGKTQLARAVATASKAAFFTVSAATLISKWMGESEKAVKDLFVLATEHRPSVIFIDEIDSLCGQRGEGNENEASRRVKNEFLAQTNGMMGVLLLAATNLPWSIDTAFRRRFKKRIYIPLPDEKAREAMFRIYLQDKDHIIADEKIRELAQKTEGYSGSDIATAIEEAHMRPLRTLTTATYFKPSGPRHWIPCDQFDEGAQPMIWEDVEDVETLVLPPVTYEDMIETLNSSKPTVSPADLAQYDTWTLEFGQGGD